jgi:hypothetical protein
MVSSQQDFASTTTDSAEKCPVDHQNRSSLWKVLGVRSKAADSTSSSSGSSLAASLEEAAKYSQLPHSHQRIPLSTYRSESSIPRSKKDNDTNITIPLPHHQLGSDSSKWVYPSEQQVFNAMKRKGWEGIEGNIPLIVPVFNNMTFNWFDLKVGPRIYRPRRGLGARFCFKTDPLTDMIGTLTMVQIMKNDMCWIFT